MRWSIGLSEGCPCRALPRWNICGRTEGDRLTFRDDIAEDHSRLMFGCGRDNRAPLSPTGKAITVTASRGMSRSSRSSRGESSVIGNVLNYLFYFVACRSEVALREQLLARSEGVARCASASAFRVARPH